MDNIIPHSYRNYGMYINSFRSFPLVMDGLKPVERRVLLTAYLVAKDKLVKSARVDGSCIAKFHPHGSAYGSIVQLVKNGFLIGQGNFGNNLGVEPSKPAAMRYTECRLSSFTKDLAFKFIKFVPWIESELDNEPLYLPTMFPLCFLGSEYTQGIGFGYRTYIPCYDKKDLFKRLKWKLGLRKTKPTIVPISDCEIIATDKELETLLTIGKASIKVKGIVKITQHQCKAVLKSWPPGKRFETILGRFKKEMENSDIGYQDLSNKERGTHIEFSVLKQRNRDKIFRAFVSKLEKVVTGSITFEIITVDSDQNVRVTPVDEMLVNTYELFKKSNKSWMEHEIKRLSENIEEINALEKLKKPLSEILQKGSKLVDKDIQLLSKKSGVDIEVVKTLISKYIIKKLLTTSTDTSKLKVDLAAINLRLKNLDKETINEYTALV